MKAYIIHLSKIENSLKSALRLKKELKQFNIRSELFEGSYGDVTKEQYQHMNRMHHPWTFKGPKKPVSEEHKIRQSTPGVIGCFDSHYRLWEKCVELDQPIMIFEDDAQVIRRLYNVEWEDVLSLVFSHNKKMNRYIDYLERPKGIPVASEYKNASMPGNAGYAIKPHAAYKLVTMYKNSFLPADNAINKHVVNIQIHNYMMGKATLRDKTEGRSSLIRTNYWSKK